MCTSTGQRAANGTNAVNSSVLGDDAVAVGHLVRKDVGEQVAAGAVGMCASPRRSMTAARGGR